MNLEKENLEEAMAAQQLEALKKEVLRQFLTKEARERLGRLRLAHPKVAAQVELGLIQAASSGQLREQIDDAKLKEILQQISSGAKSFKISRK